MRGVRNRRKDGDGTGSVLVIDHYRRYLVRLHSTKLASRTFVCLTLSLDVSVLYCTFLCCTVRESRSFPIAREESRNAIFYRDP